MALVAMLDEMVRGWGSRQTAPASRDNSMARDMLGIVKGFRNGLVYGAKIRLPHALVMTFLFRSEGFLEKLHMVGRLTATHSLNLARFVTIYKTVLILLRRLTRTRRWHSFVAGCVGGYLVFTVDNAVNNQIVLYLLSRVLTAIAKLLFARLETLYGGQASAGAPVVADPFCDADTAGSPRVGSPASIWSWLGTHAFAMEATLVWGLVMYLFREHRASLPSSLQSSMQYLYNDSDRWHGLWTLFIHNK